MQVYVTHKLRECASHVWHLISERRASTFVSGSAQQMPASVVSALEDVAQEQVREVVAVFADECACRPRSFVPMATM